MCAGCTCGVYTLRCRMIIMMSSCSTKFLKYTVCQYITQFTDSILMSGQLCTFYLRAPSRTSTVRVTCLLTHTHKRTHSFHDILNCGLKKVGSWRYCCQMIPVPRELMFVSRIRNPSCADGGPSVEHDGVSLTPSKGAHTQNMQHRHNVDRLLKVMLILSRNVRPSPRSY